jgi:hypothetical protein
MIKNAVWCTIGPCLTLSLIAIGPFDRATLNAKYSETAESKVLQKFAFPQASS